MFQARGARLAVLAGSPDVYFGGLRLLHQGARRSRPVGVDPTGGVVNTYTAGRTETGRLAYRAVEYRELYRGVTMRLSFEGRAVKADYIVAPGADPGVIRFRYEGIAAALDKCDLTPVRGPRVEL